MKYTLAQIISILGCKTQGAGKTKSPILTLLTDSRSLTTATNTLFFAIKTAHGRGSKYIAELYEAGVRSFVVDKDEDIDFKKMDDALFLICNPLSALQAIASHHRHAMTHLRMAAITGSNGKTIVKEWLHQVLSDRQRTIRSPRSYNSQIGVPLSLSLIEDDTELAIIEAGISQPGEMEHLECIISPDIVILTNLGEAHQENFRSLKEKALEKLKLAKSAQKIIFPQDDKTIFEAIKESAIAESRCFGWSKTDEQAPVFIHSVCTNKESTTISATIHQKQTVTFTIPFISEASIQNSITCLTSAIAMGYDPKEIAQKMSSLEPIAMRLEVKEGQRGLTLINDAYNSDINSLGIALDFMNRRLEQSSQERVVILSDILQTGESPETLYRKVAQMLKSQSVSQLIAVGEDICQHTKLFDIPVSCFQNTQEFIDSPEFKRLREATVLIKGARTFHFERITQLLEKRVHETILEVNLNAIVDNLNHYRSLMQPHEKIVCMVKASAYGAGSIEVSKTLQDHKVDYLAVAVADEGVALREGGIHSHIMIMNPEMTAFEDLFQYNLEPEVYNFRLLEALMQAARRKGIQNFPIHLKLDTGMHRLGFDPEHDIERLILTLQNQDALKPASIFSHFVGTDGAQFDDFTHQQFALFDCASRKIQEAFPHKILRHICNSAGIERFPEYHLDMVRLGIGLYGINPFDNSTINTISTLKTTILQIRDVVETDTVGYSRWGRLTRPSRIAAIPIGYADGLNRHLGRGRGYCLINGQKAPYVGNICMDVCMIDVTDIPCQEGDQVEIFGQNLPVTVLSDLLDTIPYEILTSVSERVKRIYFS